MIITKARRKPWLAGLLSGALPGLGQLYNGQVQKALVLGLLTSVPAIFFAGLMKYGPLPLQYNLFLWVFLSLLLYVLIILDAIRAAKCFGDAYEVRPCNTWYVYVGFVLLAIIASEFIGEPVTDHIRQHHFQAFKIPSGSMMPTLLSGDHIFVEKSLYKNGTTPQRGDIIVFEFPEDKTKDFIKRVIGIPGDTIEIRTKIVYVNGSLLDDTAYTQRIDPGIIDGTINSRDYYGPVTVPRTSYFVLGDNRDQSLDSRFFGFVDVSKIKGKGTIIYWSWSGIGNWNEWVRWDRMGQRIQ
ncbi:MAG: signal peptidase I [Nitrospira sp.]|nr:signal peptidase I [Nitrospira sp.]